MAINNSHNGSVPNLKIMTWLRRGALLLFVTAVLFLAWELTKIPWVDLKNYMPDSPWIASLVLLGVFVSKAILMVIPLNALYITASLIFPPGWAIAISYLGLAIEMSIGFAMGRKWGSGQVRDKIEKYKYSRWLLQLTERHTVISCFVFRFLPPPADIVNMFLGATRISFPKYFFSSLAGFSPKLLTIILLGEAATSSNPNTFIGIASLIAVLEFAPLLIMFWINRDKINQDNPSADKQPADEQPVDARPASALLIEEQLVDIKPTVVQPTDVHLE